MKKGYIVAGIIAFSAMGYSQFENSKTISDLQSQIKYLEDKNNTQISYNVSNTLEPAEYTIDTFADNYKEPVEEKKVEPVIDYTPVSLVTLKDDDSSYKPIVKSFSIDSNVYRTNTGSKYHKAGCRYLKSSCTEITMDQAISMGLTPCKVCRP